jgi:hypothetical protein
MGEGYARGYSITGGGFHAAINGRDPYKPTKEDEDAAGEALVEGILFTIPVGKFFQGINLFRTFFKASRTLGTNSNAIVRTADYIHYGVLRTPLTANGRFAIGTGQQVDLGVRYNIGRATAWSPVNSSIPSWAKWAAGIGGGGILANQVLNHNKNNY